MIHGDPGPGDRVGVALTGFGVFPGTVQRVGEIGGVPVALVLLDGAGAVSGVWRLADQVRPCAPTGDEWLGGLFAEANE